jgi:hypothetical protein
MTNKIYEINDVFARRLVKGSSKHVNDTYIASKQMIEDYIATGLDINARSSYYSTDCNMTPLEFACDSRSSHLMRDLLICGANITQTAINNVLIGHSPLYISFDERMRLQQAIATISRYITTHLNYKLSDTPDWFREQLSKYRNEGVYPQYFQKFLRKIGYIK